MSISGTVVRYELAAALEMLGRARSTGILSVTDGTISAQIFLVDGRILFASSQRTPPLGAFLVERGLITEDVLGIVLKLQRRKKVNQMLGTILTDLGLVSGEVIELGIEQQVKAVLQDVLSWQQGEYRFEPQKVWDGQAIAPVSGDIGQYLLQIAVQKAHPGDEAAEAVDALGDDE